MNFRDSYGVGAHVACSSAIGNYDDSLDRPGSSFLWIGVDQIKPLIMAKNALADGVVTKETTGWVPYPVPDAVLMNGDIHLNREQVRGLIDRLEHWLEHGGF
ncbi:hypothetical protein A9R05_41725 (plasmid) [Burkholderia sp. KK1]|uniref:hypothetical protein n=1 Tax=Burkholderia sp. M701 TaxID=326454 RepID=UPI000979B950|nr:hypothetical protein [Burkholderia sp. M701]AQH05550.1 hypothetical protein A9R05_41725 [Burkholderia sp. KK1]